MWARPLITGQNEIRTAANKSNGGLILNSAGDSHYAMNIVLIHMGQSIQQWAK